MMNNNIIKELEDANDCLLEIEKCIVDWHNIIFKDKRQNMNIGDNPAMFFPELISILINECLKRNDK